MRSRYAVRRLVLMICVNVPREKTERVSNSQASSQEIVRYAPLSGTRRSEARRRGREIACDVLAQRYCAALLLDNCRQKERYSSTLTRSLWRAARAESVGALFRMCRLWIE